MISHFYRVPGRKKHLANTETENVDDHRKAVTSAVERGGWKTGGAIKEQGFSVTYLFMTYITGL